MTQHQDMPSLTLTPFEDQAAAAQEAAQEQPKENGPVIDESVLTPQERAMVDDFASKIDITNANVVLQYGAQTQQKMADFSENALENVRTKDMGEVGDMVTGLIGELKNFDAQE